MELRKLNETNRSFKEKHFDGHFERSFDDTQDFFQIFTLTYFIKERGIFLKKFCKNLNIEFLILKISNFFGFFV